MSWIHILQAFVTGSFALAVAFNLLRQRRRGIQAFVLSPKPAKRLAEVLSIGGLFGWLALIGLEGQGVMGEALGPVWIDSTLADGIGAALMLSGLLSCLLAYLHMGRSWRIGIDESANEQLVTHGVFAWSRNPIYLFIDLLAIGVVLTSGTLFFIVTSPLVLLGVHFRILDEERFLMRRYGVQFESYKATTCRYLGRKGKSKA